MPDAPLAGLRVLDLSRLLPGPYCTMLLADLGAEVIKIEAPGSGDYARTLASEFGGPPMFAAVNRNKRSAAINYRHPRGRDVLLRVAEQADVFVETFRPGAVRRWGFDYPVVHSRNSRIVYCSLSGYGQAGLYANRAGHDINYLAVGGMLGLIGAAGGPPALSGVQIADLAGGMLAAIAILAALRGRDQTGAGSYLDVSMLDIVVSWVGYLAGCFREPCPGDFAVTRGKLPLGGALPCYNVFEAADGAYLTLAALEPHFWSTFCRAVGREDLLTRQLDPSAVPLVAELFARHTRQEWLAQFAGEDACLEAVNELGEMLDHPQVRERGLVNAEGVVTTPLRMVAAYPAAPAPALGEHTRAVLAETGVSPAEIDALAAEGVIA